MITDSDSPLLICYAGSDDAGCAIERGGPTNDAAHAHEPRS